MWEYVIEPVEKATYWDKSLPTQERRAKAKRLPLPVPKVEHESDEASSEDAESDNEPIYKTIWKSGFTPKLASNAIGMKVAQNFGKRGVYTGEISAYSVDDDLYTVLYTDGDAEDYDEAEYLAAVHLFRVNKRNKEEAEDSANLSSVEEDASPSEAELSSDSSDDKPKDRKSVV